MEVAMINQYRRSTTGGMGRYSHHTHGLNTFFAFTFGLFETINIEWESKDLMSFIAIISKSIYHSMHLSSVHVHKPLKGMFGQPERILLFVMLKIPIVILNLQFFDSFIKLKR